MLALRIVSVDSRTEVLLLSNTQSQNVRHFGLGDIGEQNCDVKHKQSQLIGMDSVSDICKYHLLCFMTIIEVKVMSGNQVKKVKQKNFVI